MIMKTINTLKKVALGFCTLFLANQATSQLTIGGGLAYGSEIEEAGLNFRAGALLSPIVHVGADVNYFFPGNDGISDIDVFDINANLSFRLNAAEVLFLYPMVGLNYTSIRTRLFGLERQNNEIGANVGGGLGLNFGPLSPFIEYKYVFSKYEQSVITVGLLINLGSAE